MELKNEFSWSKSRDALFSQCRRKYFYDKYASWGGWERNSDARARELYILKSLKTAKLYAGELFHDIAGEYLARLRAGKHVPLGFLLSEARSRFNSAYYSSENRLYAKDPGKTGFYEHEYSLPMDRQEWEKLYAFIESCITNFYNSNTLNDIKKTDRQSWITPEDILSFDFEGTPVYLKIDFALKHDGKLVIYDWKTGRERDVGMDASLGLYSIYSVEKYETWPEDLSVVKYNAAIDKEDSFAVSTDIYVRMRQHIRKSISEMKGLLAVMNTQGEESFGKTSDTLACSRCNFRKACK